MKFKLMIQSLSPLALLTIIRNFSFVTVDDVGERLSAEAFLHQNIIILFVMLICSLWIILAIWCFVQFKAFHFTDKESGYTVTSVHEDETAGLNFFITLIIPLLLDDVGSIQGALTFLIIVAMLCVLLARTNLFYANPVLALIGFRVYKFKFVDNSGFTQDCIGLCYGIMGENNSIEYKKITDSVLYVGRMDK